MTDQIIEKAVAELVESLCIARLAEILDEVDDMQGPSNYTEDNYEAGWHHCIAELQERLGQNNDGHNSSATLQNDTTNHVL